jgi:hypothetical protein
LSRVGLGEHHQRPEWNYVFYRHLLSLQGSSVDIDKFPQKGYRFISKSIGKKRGLQRGKFSIQDYFQRLGRIIQVGRRKMAISCSRGVQAAYSIRDCPAFVAAADGGT